MALNKLTLIILFCVISCTHVFSQDSDFEIGAEATLLGLASNNNNPFWFKANTNGAIGNTTNILLSAGTFAKYNLSENSLLSAGVSLFVRDGVEDNLQRNELFVQFDNKYITAVVGSKNPKVLYNGLSTVNENFILSGNARAIPGIVISAPQLIKIYNGIFIDYGLGNYFLNDERVVTNTNIHYKKFGVQWQINSNNAIYGGIEHYAQWNGTSPEFGRQPHCLKDYIDVFLARRAGGGSTDNDILNALGNHLGFYNLKYNYQSTVGGFQLYHQHPFEDGSGTALKNFPDGIWGCFFEPSNSETHFLKSILFEYVQTISQSGGFDVTGGADNYFGNSIYRSGWTYEKNIIGLPLIVPNADGIKLINNRTKAIHIGATASVKKFNFKTKVTFAQNFGTYGKPFATTENAIYSYLQSDYLSEKLGKFSVQFGLDHSNLQNDKLGAGASYSYSF